MTHMFAGANFCGLRSRYLVDFDEGDVGRGFFGGFDLSGVGAGI